MSVAGNKKRVFITLDLNILEQLEFLAEKKGVNKSSLISFWISDEYERVKNSEKKDEKKYHNNHIKIRLEHSVLNKVMLSR